MTIYVHGLRSVNGFLDRLYVNIEILHNEYLILPVEKDHIEYSQMGRGQVTSPEWCGKHTSFFVCGDKGSHKGVVYNGEDYTDKLAVTHGHIWCHKASCPVCFLRGYATREARAIAGKLMVGVERGFGDVEHFTVSFPKKDYDLPEAELRRRAEVALLRRGFMGAALIVHARRIDRRHRCLKFAIHYHGLGFISGGYDVCRHCSSHLSHVDCASCRGFEGRTRREYEKDGLIVKVFDKRSSGTTMEESVIKTAVYQLSHASQIISFRKRFHIVSYFGVCSNKKLKSRKVKAVQVCPVCASVGVHNEMKKCSHRGKDFIATNIGDLLYKRCFPSEEFDESGLPRFVDYGGGGLDG